MFLKRLLRRTPLYPMLRYSRLYAALFGRKASAVHEKEVALYRTFLDRPRLIFDIGAYDGHKTAAFLELADQVVACEPDPFNFRRLRLRFRRWRGRVTLYRVAVSDRVGTGRFFVHHPGSAFNTLNPKWVGVLEEDGGARWNEAIRFLPDDELKVVTTTLDELILTHGVPDFIKIDAEGSERKVFDGLNRRVPCVSWECLLPEFEADLFYILRKLMAMDPRTVFNVVHEEGLVFQEFVPHDALVRWLDGSPPFSFDVVART
ncbi:MAG TPA: FkbM family methyltransferase [Puia sp.]|nr:FkbM family methyltransferase [Puia sp.]